MPATFVTIINEALRGQLKRNVLIYLDDIVLFSPIKEKPLKDLQQTLDMSRKN